MKFFQLVHLSRFDTLTQDLFCRCAQANHCPFIFCCRNYVSKFWISDSVHLWTSVSIFFSNSLICLCRFLFFFSLSCSLSLSFFFSLFFFFFLWWLLDELSGDSFYPPIIYKSLPPESLKSASSGLRGSSMETFNPLVVPQSCHKCLSI